MAVVIINKKTKKRFFCMNFWANNVKAPRVIYSLEKYHHEDNLKAYKFKREFNEAGFIWYVFTIDKCWKVIPKGDRPHYPLKILYSREGVNREVSGLGSCLCA